MATTPVSVEDYLNTSASPDCEYVCGLIQERAVPERDHAEWQEMLTRWFGNRERAWDIQVFPELRVQVAPENYRVPDVCLLSGTAPREQIVTYPPLAVFEIPSPTDRMTDVLEKLEDYQQMGIPAIWLIEPKKPTCYVYSSGQLSIATIFRLPGSDFSISMQEIAADADPL